MADVATYETTSRVGMREFRARLSDYIDAVKSGRSFFLTERGTIVAQLTPPAAGSVFEELLRDGIIEPPRARTATLPTPLVAAGPVSDLVSEQRR